MNDHSERSGQSISLTMTKQGTLGPVIITTYMWYTRGMALTASYTECSLDSPCPPTTRLRGQEIPYLAEILQMYPEVRFFLRGTSHTNASQLPSSVPKTRFSRPTAHPAHPHMHDFRRAHWRVCARGAGCIRHRSIPQRFRP